MDSRIEAEVKAQAEREMARAEARQRKIQMEQEEKAREQLRVTLKDDKGYTWDETQSAQALGRNLYRDSETRKLRTYSDKPGHLDKTYEVVHVQSAPPAKARRKKEEREE